MAPLNPNGTLHGQLKSLKRSLRGELFVSLRDLGGYLRSIDENAMDLGAASPNLGELSVQSFVRLVPLTVGLQLPRALKKHIFTLTYLCSLERAVLEVLEKVKDIDDPDFEEYIALEAVENNNSLPELKEFIIKNCNRPARDGARRLQGRHFMRKILCDIDLNISFSLKVFGPKEKVPDHYLALSIKSFLQDRNKPSSQTGDFSEIGRYCGSEEWTENKCPFIVSSKNPRRRWPSGLNERDSDVLSMRYNNKMTLEQIGCQFGITVERVGQISLRAENRMLKGDLKYDSIDLFFSRIFFHFANSNYFSMLRLLPSGAWYENNESYGETRAHLSLEDLEGDEVLGLPFRGLQEKLLSERGMEIFLGDLVCRERRDGGPASEFQAGYLLSVTSKKALIAMRAVNILQRDSEEYVFAKSVSPHDLFRQCLRDHFKHNDALDCFVSQKALSTELIADFLALNGGSAKSSELMDFMQISKHNLLGTITRMTNVGYDRISGEVGLGVDPPKKINDLVFEILEDKKLGISAYDLSVEVNKFRRASDWSLAGIKYHKDVGVLPNDNLVLLKYGGSPEHDNYFGPVPRGCREYENGDFSVLFEVTEDVLRGSGTGITSWALKKCGMTRWPDSKEFHDQCSRSIYIRKNATQSSISSLRELVVENSFRLGDKFIIKFSPENKRFSLLSF